MADALVGTSVVVGNDGAIVMGNGRVGLKSIVEIANAKLFSMNVPHRHSTEPHP